MLYHYMCHLYLIVNYVTCNDACSWLIVSYKISMILLQFSHLLILFILHYGLQPLCWRPNIPYDISQNLGGASTCSPNEFPCSCIPRYRNLVEQQFVQIFWIHCIRLLVARCFEPSMVVHLQNVKEFVKTGLIIQTNKQM